MSETFEPQNPWDQATGAAHAVALEVLLNGPIPRSELARRLQLSPASVTRLTKSLLDSDLFVEGPVQIEPQSGRPTRPLDIVPNSRLFIGVRLTEWEAQGVLTTIRAEVVDRCTYRFQQVGPSDILAGLIEVINKLRRNESVTAVGVSIGGQVSHHRTVTRAPFFHWSKPVDLAAELSQATDLPVVLDNDVVALTRNQLWFGLGRRTPTFAMITIGIATGLGLAVGHRVIEREDSGLGMIGHLPLDPFGPICPEGHRGCAQAMLSIGSISAAVSTALGRLVPFEDCLELARSGSAPARRVVDDAARALGRLVGIVASCTLADHVMIAGEAIELAEVDRTAVHAGIEEVRPQAASEIHLHIEPISTEPWSRGAASLAIKSYVLGVP